VSFVVKGVEVAVRSRAKAAQSQKPKAKSWFSPMFMRFVTM
jgi:hypothetical protein